MGNEFVDSIMVSANTTLAGSGETVEGELLQGEQGEEATIL